MRIRSFVCTLIASLAIPHTAHALTINVDIGNSALYSGIGAATDPGTVWNQYALLGGGTIAGLVDSVGGATGVAFDLAVTPDSFFVGPGVNDLADSIALAASPPFFGANENYAFLFTGLAPNSRYDVYLLGPGDLDPSYQSSDTPIPALPVAGVFAASALAGVSDASGTLQGFFFRPFVLEITPAQGIQIQSVSVPEPAVMLLLIPLLGLVVRRRGGAG